MNNRFTTLDLCKILAEKTGKDIEWTTRFVKELLDILSTQVDESNAVEIKGLGTFKAQYIEERESIHIHSNERFIIPAHYRYVFVADKKLRDIVNKPFAFFESVELAEGISMEDLTISEEDDSDENEELYDDSIPIEEVVAEPIPDSIIDEPSESLESFEEPFVSPEEINIEDIESKEETQAIQVEEEEVVAEEKELMQEVEQKEIIDAIEDFEEAESVDTEITEMNVVGEADSEQDDTTAEPEEITQPRVAEEEEETIEEDEFSEISVEQGGSRKMLITVFSIAAIALIAIFIYKNSSNDSLPDKQQKPGIIVQDTLTKIVESIHKDSIDNLTDIDSIKASSIGGNISDNQPNINDKSRGDEVKEVPPKELPSVLDRVTIQPGDLLTVYALKYYGKKVFWVYLYEHNKKVIKNPHNVPIGTTIEIPSPHLYGIDAKNKESVDKAVKRQSELAADTFK